MGDRRLVGVMLVVGTTLCFATLDMTAKLVGGDIPLAQLVFGRYLFNCLFVLLLIVRPTRLPNLRTRTPGIHMLRAVLLVGSTLTFWAGLQHLGLAEAIAIGFAAPLIVTVLSIPVLGERVGIHRWTSVLVGLLGVLILIRPGTGVFDPAALFPLATALCYGTYQVLTRRIAGQDSALNSLLYTAAGGFFVSVGLVTVFGWQPLTLAQWGILAGMGFLGGFGHLLLIKAIELAPPSLLAPFSYLTIVWGTAWGMLIFADLPDRWTLVGAAIIVASGLYILHRERVRREQA